MFLPQSFTCVCNNPLANARGSDFKLIWDIIYKPYKLVGVLISNQIVLLNTCFMGRLMIHAKAQ